MRIKSVNFRQFRRFADLTISDIPPTARLVIMLGPNGKGKSSVFDGFLSSSRELGGWGFNINDDYFQRQADIANNDGAVRTVEFHSLVPLGQKERRKLFNVRTAHRNDPDFGAQRIERPAAAVDELRFSRTIDNDAAIKKNYDRYIYRTIDDVYDPNSNVNRKLSVEDYAATLVRRISEPLERVLPGLKFVSLGKPGQGDATFYFSKDGQNEFQFKNLSGGEKAAFDLLLDMVVKVEEFNDTIFCIDEPEAHLNPAVHGQCLQELYELTPGNCQLWIATHSIGMLRRARDLAIQNPGQVIFLDFDKNCDSQVDLKPVAMTRENWSQALKVALDDLAALVAPEQIIVCEGGNKATAGQLKEDAIDAVIYNQVFSQEYPGVRFFSAGSHSDTAHAKNALLSISSSVLTGLTVNRLIDRDDRSDVEVAEARASGVLVLKERHLESYIYSNEILERLYADREQLDKLDAII